MRWYKTRFSKESKFVFDKNSYHSYQNGKICGHLKMLTH